MRPWYKEWFTEDYLTIYSHRNEKEAQKQVEFICQQLPLHGSEKILDLCCGAGRHAALLAKKGFDTTGLDQSEQLLAIAKKYLENNPDLPLRFIEDDMRNCAAYGPFDLLLSLFTSFGYFETDEENLKLLYTIYQTIQPQGWFVIDYLNPVTLRESLIPFETLKLNKMTVTIERIIEKNRIKKLIHFPHQTYKESVALYEHDQLIQMLESASLFPQKIFSSFNGDPWNAHGKRQILFCKKMVDGEHDRKQ